MTSHRISCDGFDILVGIKVNIVEKQSKSYDVAISSSTVNSTKSEELPTSVAPEIHSSKVGKEINGKSTTVALKEKTFEEKTLMELLQEYDDDITIGEERKILRKPLMARQTTNMNQKTSKEVTKVEQPIENLHLNPDKAERIKDENVLVPSIITTEKNDSRKKRTVAELMKEDDTRSVDYILNYSSNTVEENKKNGWYTVRKKRFNRNDPDLF
jgi:hypothetical protein